MAIPAKYVLYCDYPGAEFREEFDGSNVDYSDKGEDYPYSEYVNEYEYFYDEIGDCLRNNFEKFLDGYFTEDNVPACGYICYDEVRTDVFGNNELCLNEDIKVYLSAVSEDGTTIDTDEIKIEKYVNLESQKAFLMECGFGDDTDEYIEIALGKFVKESEWYYCLRKGDQYLDVEDWPEPKEDCTWVDEDGTRMEPLVWFGNGYISYEDMWILNGENWDFWSTGDPNYGGIVECHYDAFAGFCGEIPGFEEAVKSCPILIDRRDTPESIDKKIQAFFVEKYKEAHCG